MKKAPLLFILFLSAIAFTQAQDTVVVQTFKWDDPDNFRNGVFDFPNDDPNSWSKILMLYNMRCHDLQVGNGAVGCREWDYSCNTFITDSTIVDSTQLKHPTHIISGFDNSPGQNFRYSNSPVYTYFIHNQHNITYNSTVTESTAKVGGEDLAIPFSLSKSVSRQQFLFTAGELSAAGFSTGELTGMKLNITAAGDTDNFLRIRIKSTDQTALKETEPDLSDFTEVYFKNTDFSSTGEHFFRFYKNYDWNGSDNLIVEFSFTNESSSNQPMVSGHQTADLKTLAYTGGLNDYSVRFDKSGAIRLPNNAYDAVSEQITISLWAKGNETLPLNTHAFEGTDDNNLRQANVHLPWSNGQIYWDCGNDGAGYDRINKQATDSEFKGDWTFWTLTKNAATGSMKIYKNGDLWHSGTAKNKTIDLKKFIIGANINGSTNYDGAIDGLEIWSKELDAVTIKERMHLAVNSSHPDFDDLVAYMPFDEGTGRATDGNSPNALTGNFEGSPSWVRTRGKDLFKSFSTVNLRPAITFVRGDYDITEQIVQVIDSIENAPNQIVSYGTVGTDLTPLDTIFAWNADNSLIYNAETGAFIDFKDITPDGQIAVGEFDYYQKRPGKFEILSLVTPYGNGLNLGSEGKTFTIDVTDYAPILQGRKRMSLEMGGQSQEEMNIQFVFIKGTPTREIISVQNIWPFRRGNINQILDDTYFEPRNMNLDSDGSAFKIRSAITGHGQNGEFISRNHFFNVNGGTKEFEFDVWKECSDMPIYPQGGTWLFDRAGWCPGVPTDVHEFDISDMVTPGGSVEIDYGLNGLTMDQANYLVNAQFITYGAPNFNLDAEVLEIIRPTTKLEHARLNPACNRPMVRIKNNGTSDLTALTIEYGERNGTKLTYDWIGNIKFLETEDIELPLDNLSLWSSLDGDIAQFEVKLLEVNGSNDENSQNDLYVTPFERAKIVDRPIEIAVRTNNVGSETSYRLLDIDGNVLLERNGLSNNTRYADEFTLGRGCYTFEINDSGDDGLYYWYWEQTGQSRGRGSATINRIFSNGIKLPLKSMEAEFGRFVSYDFSVPEYTNTLEPGQLEFFSIYPNPSSDFVNLDLRGFESRDFEIKITNVSGQTVLQKRLTELSDDHRETIDISNFAPGFYFINVNNGKRTWVRELIKQ